MTDPTNPSQAPAGVPHCYRHPGTETWIRCQRCERPICPDCMREAAVGFQCPSCVSQGAKETRQGLGPYGGRRSADPRATSIALIAVNVAVWIAVMATGGRSSSFLEKIMLTPLGRCMAPDGVSWFPNITSADVCVTEGGLWEAAATDGAWWQVVTNGFAHVDLMHIAFNCFAIWALGPAIESALGRVRFLALYFVSLFAASVTVLWFSDERVPTLGASGAVFGLLAAMLVLVWKVGGDTKSLLTVLALNVAITIFVPNISWQGHLGGFVGGALVTLLLVFAPRGSRRPAVQWTGIGLLTVALLALAVVRALVIHSP